MLNKINNKKSKKILTMKILAKFLLLVALATTIKGLNDTPLSMEFLSEARLDQMTECTN